MPKNGNCSFLCQDCFNPPWNCIPWTQEQTRSLNPSNLSEIYPVVLFTLRRRRNVCCLCCLGLRALESCSEVTTAPWQTKPRRKAIMRLLLPGTGQLSLVLTWTWYAEVSLRQWLWPWGWGGLPGHTLSILQVQKTRVYWTCLCFKFQSRSEAGGCRSKRSSPQLGGSQQQAGGSWLSMDPAFSVPCPVWYDTKYTELRVKRSGYILSLPWESQSYLKSLSLSFLV